MTKPLDPRMPVLVGAGQVAHRGDEATNAPAPHELMVDALRAAESDSSGHGLLASVDSIRTVGQLSWRYPNVGRLVAEDLGAAPGQYLESRMGGNLAGSMVIDAARAIQAGHAEVVVVCGAEAWRSRSRARSAGIDLPWPSRSADPAAGEPPELYGPSTSAELGRRTGTWRDGRNDDLRPLRRRPSSPPRTVGRRPPPTHQRAVERVLRRGGAQSPRLVADGDGPGRHPRAQRLESHDLVPVHEAPVLEQPRGPGGGPRPHLGRGRRAARHPTRSLGLPARRGRGRRPLVAVRTRRPALLPRHPPRRPGPLRARPHRCRQPSTTSTSTRASRRRCRSRPRSWASPHGSRPPGPGGAGSTPGCRSR